MPYYVVNVREVHIQPYAVKASSEEEAIEIVNDGGGIMIEGDFVYSHSLDPDYWDVREASEDDIEEYEGYFEQFPEEE